MSLEDVAAPNCPQCLKPMEATVGAWWCPDCRLARSVALEPLGAGENPAVAAAWGEAAVKAVAGALGPLAPIASFLVDGTFSARNAAALERWIAIVDERFAAAGRMFNPDDPIAVAYFNRLSIGAMQTHQDEKRRLLADAAVNVGTRRDFNDALQRRFVDLALQLGPEHVAFLQLLLNPAPFLNSIGISDPRDYPDALLLNVVNRSILGGLPDDELELVWETIWRMLSNEGLTSASYGTGSTVADIDRVPVSPLGLRFLEFLERSPVST